MNWEWLHSLCSLRQSFISVFHLHYSHCWLTTVSWLLWSAHWLHDKACHSKGSSFEILWCYTTCSDVQITFWASSSLYLPCILSIYWSKHSWRPSLCGQTLSWRDISYQLLPLCRPLQRTHEHPWFQHWLPCYNNTHVLARCTWKRWAVVSKCIYRIQRVSVFTGLDYWNGLVDWTTGLIKMNNFRFFKSLK